MKKPILTITTGFTLFLATQAGAASSFENLGFLRNEVDACRTDVLKCEKIDLNFYREKILNGLSVDRAYSQKSIEQKESLLELDLALEAKLAAKALAEPTKAEHYTILRNSVQRQNWDKKKEIDADKLFLAEHAKSEAAMNDYFGRLESVLSSSGTPLELHKKLRNNEDRSKALQELIWSLDIRSNSGFVASPQRLPSPYGFITQFDTTQVRFLDSCYKIVIPASLDQVERLVGRANEPAITVQCKRPVLNNLPTSGAWLSPKMSVNEKNRSITVYHVESTYRCRHNSLDSIVPSYCTHTEEVEKAKVQEAIEKLSGIRLFN